MISLETKSNPDIKTGYSDVNGIKMYYEIHGNKGEWLVLIHGGGSTIGTSFGRILPVLAQNFKILAMELQAHGHTGDRDTPESFEQDSDDVVTLMKNLGISQTSILGFSNGGNTAMMTAINHPNIVNKLILASTFYKREGMVQGLFEGMKQATLANMPEGLKNAFLEVNPDNNALLNMFNKDRERMMNFKNWDESKVGSIKAPTLIINGDRDVIQTSHALEISNKIKDSRLMILPASHGSYFGVAESPLENNAMPEFTAGVIINFIKNQ